MLRRVLYIGHPRKYSLHEAFSLPADRSRGEGCNKTRTYTPSKNQRTGGAGQKVRFWICDNNVDLTNLVVHDARDTLLQWERLRG